VGLHTATGEAVGVGLRTATVEGAAEEGRHTTAEEAHHTDPREGHRTSLEEAAEEARHTAITAEEAATSWAIAAS